jgi:hypothetical protein
MRDIIGKSAYNYLQANRIGEEMKTILDNVMSISDLYAINNPKTNPRYGMTSNIVVKYLDQKARILKLNMTENVVQQAHFITLRDSGDQRTLMQNIREQYYPVAIYNQFIRELYDTNQGEKLSDNDLEIIRFVLDNEFITDHEVIAYAGYLVHISEKDNK